MRRSPSPGVRTRSRWAVVEGEGDVGMAEGGAGDGGDDVTELSAFGLEELEAGRDGSEEAVAR